MCIGMLSLRWKNSRLSLLVFDSGIGGLGVVAEIRRIAPGLGMDYLADDGFYPYGQRPDEALTARILEVVGAAIGLLRPAAVVVACNTASTIALGALRAAFDVPFVGCVPPVKPAAAASVSRHIGLLATPATIRRPYLQDLVARFAGDCEVHSLGTPVLADLAEGKFRGVVVDMAALAAAVAPVLADGRVDAVALGCTHYTFLLPEFAALRRDLRWFDPAGAVARQAVRVVGRAGGGGGFFVTGAVRDAAMMARRIEGYGFSAIERLGVPAA
jgi:glutamate racemase